MKASLIVLICILTLELIACFDCPQPDGLFADPTDPHYYYNCGAGRAYRVKCNAGLVFNTDINECDYNSGTSGPNITTSNGDTTVTSTPSTVTVPVTTPVVGPVVTTAAPIVTTAEPVVTTAAPILTTAEPVVTTAAPVVTTTEPVVTTAAPIITTAEPITTTSSPTTIPPTTEAITTPNPTTIPTTQQITTVELTTPTAAATTPPPVITTASTVVSTTQDPFWLENKAKIQSELAHLNTYMTNVLRDSQDLIKENKVESMNLMVTSIKSEIAKIESFELIIADELKKVTKLTDKFFLENSAQTLVLDKQELNNVLLELNKALASK